ncbi:MAG: hypothetical protein ABW298_01220 [Candidatus Binatia bacterium]|jgi:hypothetical protein
MKRSIACLSLVAVLALSGSALAFPGDEYDDSESHPLRTAAYILHPVGVGLEYAIYRPLHWLVSLNDTTELIFGHRPHGTEELRSLICTPLEGLTCSGAYVSSSASGTTITPSGSTSTSISPPPPPPAPPPSSSWTK